MRKAGYCSECKRYVWMTDTGCENGHPKSCLRNVHETMVLPASGSTPVIARPVAPPPAPAPVPVAKPAAAPQAAPVPVPAPVAPPQAATPVPVPAPVAPPQAVAPAPVPIAPPASAATAPALVDPLPQPWEPRPVPIVVPPQAPAPAAIAENPALGTNAEFQTYVSPLAHLNTSVVGLRAVAVIIDFITIVIILVVIQIALRQDETNRLAVTVVIIVYFTAFEFLTQSTPGKMLFGLKVYSENGDRASILQLLTRNVIRMFDHGFFFGMPALISALTHEDHQRYGDRPAHTIVAKPMK